jgi:hypothetical protein
MADGLSRRQETNFQTPMNTPIKIGEIGNYYGGLHVKLEDGKPYWSIEDWDGHHWQDIPQRLYQTLVDYERERLAPILEERKRLLDLQYLKQKEELESRFAFDDSDINEQLEPSTCNLDGLCQ